MRNHTKAGHALHACLRAECDPLTDLFKLTPTSTSSPSPSPPPAPSRRLAEVQLGSEWPHKCGYCGSRRGSRSRGFHVESMSCGQYQMLIDRGWRRSGKYCYLPSLDTCCPQHTIRLRVSRFQASAEQRKCLRRFATQVMTIVEGGSCTRRDISRDPAPRTNTFQKKDVRGPLPSSVVPPHLGDALTMSLTQLPEDLTIEPPIAPFPFNTSSPAPFVAHKKRPGTFATPVARQWAGKTGQDVAHVAKYLASAIRRCLEESCGPGPGPRPGDELGQTEMMGWRVKAQGGFVNVTVDEKDVDEGKEKEGREGGGIAGECDVDVDHNDGHQHGNGSGEEMEEEKNNTNKKKKKKKKKQECKHQQDRTDLLPRRVVRCDDPSPAAPMEVEAVTITEYPRLVVTSTSASRDGALGLALSDQTSIFSPNQVFSVTTHRAAFDEEEYQLYRKYQMAVHDDEPAEITRKRFRGFLVESPLRPVEEYGWGSFHMQYRIGGRLVAVGVVDLLPRCLSSKYFFYDPDERRLALGRVGALVEIQWIQQMQQQQHLQPPPRHEEGTGTGTGTSAYLNPNPNPNPSPNLCGRHWSSYLEHYYMGYYIESCPKMRYKADYAPSELRCPVTGRWVDVADCASALRGKNDEARKTLTFYRARGDLSDLHESIADDDHAWATPDLDLDVDFTQDRGHHPDQDQDREHGLTSTCLWPEVLLAVPGTGPMRAGEVVRRLQVMGGSLHAWLQEQRRCRTTDHKCDRHDDQHDEREGVLDTVVSVAGMMEGLAREVREEVEWVATRMGPALGYWVVYLQQDLPSWSQWDGLLGSLGIIVEKWGEERESGQGRSDTN